MRLLSRAAFTTITACLLTHVPTAAACPPVNGLVDFNCDGKHRIAATGDSIVFGVGDELHDDSGGYMLRLKSFYPRSRIFNLGYPGITTARLLGFYKTLFRRKPNHAIIRQLATSDILIIDVGRNDYFNRNPADVTVTTIQRLVKFLSTKLKSRFKTAPLIATTVLTPTNREFDAPFVLAVNELLLELRSGSLPAFLRFDLMDPLLLSEDGLHPSSAGYDSLGLLADEYIRDDAQERSLVLRPDEDGDGIYDVFEKTKYGTSPKLTDSDGDGLRDGGEVFTHKTDPNNPDTDGDGVDDKTEIQQGTNPRAPGGSPVLPVPTDTPAATPTGNPVATPTGTPTETPTPVP